MNNANLNQKNAPVDPKAFNDIVGGRIRQLRSSMGVTRQALAEKIGLTHQQLQKYENGSNRISVGRLAQIAHALAMPINHFLVKDEGLAEKHTNDFAKERWHIELMRHMQNIEDPQVKEALRDLIKLLG